MVYFVNADGTVSRVSSSKDLNENQKKVVKTRAKKSLNQSFNDASSRARRMPK